MSNTIIYRNPSWAQSAWAGVVLFDGTRLSVDEVLSDLTRVQCWVSKIVWADGRESWGKSWVDRSSRECVMIGAGAYGDALLYRRTR